MKYGLSTVAAAVPRVALGDCAENAARVLALAREADARGAALITFPELCLTGATCGDLFTQEHLLNEALAALETVRLGSQELSCALIVGLPLRCGCALYDCAAVVHQGRVCGVVPKTVLPSHGEFSDTRHFAPAPADVCELELLGQSVPFGAKLVFASSLDPLFRFGVELGDDLWAPVPPSAALCRAGALLICNPAAGTEIVGRAGARRGVVRGQSAKTVCAYLTVNAGEGESTTDAVFGGHSLIAERGALLGEGKPFAQVALLLRQIDLGCLSHERIVRSTFTPVDGFRTVTLPLRAEDERLTRAVDPDPFVPSGAQARAERCDSILTMQAAGLKRRLEHTRCRAAVIGISGGLDSTLALLVTCRAFDMLGLDKSGICAVTMPCFGTTSRTKNNAYALCSALGVSLREISIAAAVRQHFEDIGQSIDDHDVTFENAQARERTQVLMDVANKLGGMVIGTGDLSELALGWATYNGDHMSMYDPNGSVPKTLVRHLVAYCAETAARDDLARVLRDILDTPVSPELLPPTDGEISQKTEDLVGPYRLHDFFLYNTLRHGFSPAKVYLLAQKAFEGVYDGAFILGWLRVFYRRFFAQQFKRSCMPDGPRVGSVTLSPRGDWHMPSDALAASWLREVDGLQ